MKTRRSISLNLWLPLLVLGLFVLLFPIMSWQQYHEHESAHRQSALRSLTQDMASLQREMEKEFNDGDIVHADQALSARGTNSQYEVLVATDEKGMILHATRFDLKNRQATQALPEFDKQRFNRIKQNRRPDILLEPDRRQITAYFPLTLSRRPDEIRPSRTGTLFLVYDLSGESAEIWGRVIRSIFPIGLLLFFSMIALIGFLRYFITRPIHHLASTAQALARGESGVLTNISGHGELARLGKVFNDMSQELEDRTRRRVQAEKALRKSEIQHIEAQKIAQLGHYTYDIKMDRWISSVELDDIFGIDENYQRNVTSWLQIVHPDWLDTMSSYLQDDVLTRHRKFDKEFKIINLTTRQEKWVHGLGSLRIDDNSNPIEMFGTIQDVTERKRAEELLLHQAHFDVLTDLPNRLLTLDRLSQLLKESQRNNTLVGVLFLDLDDFKKVNDTLGHETGDKLLIEAADRLRNVARKGDTVGRLGGDEFIVLVGGLTDPEDTRPVVKNLIKQFRDPFKIDDRELILTASVGIAVFPGDGDTASDLLRKADSAMYYAKDLGRNTYAYYTHAMNREAARRIVLEEQMHGARDRGEFFVLYQPQIDLSNDSVVGSEALLRWTNPSMGTVSPNEFIPVAEKTGMIVPLGEFVLATALSMTIRLHRDYDPEFRMAVNLSPRQFRDPDLVNFIKKTLDQFGVSGNCLELEITEGLLLSGHDYIDEVLAELSNMGIHISMDDFGTGYSSLSYLRNYPFDVLKIDQSFVRDITVDLEDQALIDATIAMAHGLNMKVIAEGVETEEQRAYLKKQGCDYAQGDFFAKPMSDDDLLEWVGNRVRSELQV